MAKHGIFINYKRSHKHLAGRIYDFFKNKGLSPFMDDYSMHQAYYPDELITQVKNTPFFLCLLTEDAIEELTTAAPTKSDDDCMYYREIKAACESNRRILVLVYGNINYSELEKLPQEIKKIKGINSYKIPDENRLFYNIMEQLFSNDIAKDMSQVQLDWPESFTYKSNVWLAPRSELEKGIASFENRFGSDVVESVRSNRSFEGENRIKEVNMVCYAASLILCHASNHIDRKAYDYGMMFNIFAALLADPDFSFRLVINAPRSSATEDAINYSKLGNSSFENNEQLVFLASYANLCEMKNHEPYKTAFDQKRFRFLVTDCALPYAMFQIEYKDGYEKYNHIKIDLYSCNLNTSVDRRSMMIFQNSDPDNYAFFSNQIQLFNDSNCRSKSEKIIRKNHSKWIKEWEKNKPAQITRSDNNGNNKKTGN